MIPIVILQGYGPHERRIIDAYAGGHEFTVRSVPRPVLKTDRTEPNGPNGPTGRAPRNLEHLLEACRWCERDLTGLTNAPLLVIRDSALPLLCRADLHARLSALLTSPELPLVDLFYLCHWEDACQKYTTYPIPGVSRNETWAKYTMAPHGNQAWLITPQGRKRLLGSLPLRDKYRNRMAGYIASAGVEPLAEDPDFPDLSKVRCDARFEPRSTTDSTLHYYISRGELRSVVTTANWFEFDLNLCQKNSHFRRCNRCIAIPDASTQPENRLLTSLLWIVLFIVLLIFLGIALLQMRA